MIFESFSVILRQISLGVHSYAVVHFPCLTKKSFKNRDFWVFAVTLGQMSLGVHSHAVVHFPCLTKKSSKNRDLGLFGDTASNITRSTFARCCSFSLSYEKILQKSRFWVFSEMLRQISLGVPTVRRCSFSLSYEKILQKSRLLGLCRNARSNVTRSTDSTLSFISRQSDQVCNAL